MRRSLVYDAGRRTAGARTAGALLVAAVVSAGIVAGCSDSERATGSAQPITPGQVAAADTAGVTIRLVTHDSFTITDGLFDNFTDDTGITVEVTSSGDAGELVSKSILTAGQPEADVLFGIDNTFLQRGLNAKLFTPYAAPALAQVPDELELDSTHAVTPIDYGDVCVNYWKEGVPGGTPPTSMDDLTRPDLAASFVTEDPETSSPGFAFLLATIAAYGPDGWEGYWQRLADGGVTVSSGWEDAYYSQFRAGGEGDKSLVTSYASSPVAEVVFAEPPVDIPPTGVVLDSCFRQVEFAGILAGTEHPEAAAKLIDFLLSDTFQADIPLNMFVSPASSSVAVPDAYTKFTAVPTRTLSLDPATIEANRAQWTDRWRQIVLG
jgi:thiamine transport system substrate-binding protein